MKVGRQVVKYLLVVIVALGITIAATSCGFFGGNEKPIRPTNNISDNQISADKDETAIGEKDEAAVDNETEGSFEVEEENYGGITSGNDDETVNVPEKEDGGEDTVVPSTPNADNVVEDEGAKAYKDGMELTVNEYGGYTVTDYDGKAASIAIPETYNGKTITKIGAWAFKDCTGITSVSVPSGVTVIDTGAFYGCSSLNELTVVAGNKVYRSEGNCIISIVTQELMIGCKGSVIPEKNVKSIANYAFYGCTGLENINIPQNITEIGVSSFEDCVSLTEITFPETLTEIKSSAFERCEALENITFTSKEKSKSAVIGSSAFEGCESLNSIVFNNAVEKIGIQAFYDCTSLVEVIVPDAVKEIGESAFGGCVSLENITIPFVGKNYENYYNLGYIFKIRKNSDSSGSVPSSLKTVKVSNGKEKVTLFNDSFGNCSYINEIIIGEGVESIDYHAFYNCKSLQKITISGTDLTTIRGKAFEDCILLKSFELPACVTELEPTAFYKCVNLATLTAAEGNEKYSSEENCIIETETKKIIAGCEGSVIPASVTSIGESAFEGCSFAEITIPSNIVEIGNSAFSGCGNLEKVNLSKGLETIGGSAFSYAAITSIEIPASVTSIGYDAFYECNELASVTLKEGLKTIGDYAFYSTAISEITLNDGLETIGASAFENCSALNTINVPATVTSIGDNAFKGCTAITSIEIPASVTSIGNDAFYGCNELTSVTLSKGLETIGASAFENCSALMVINIPATVTSIGNNAFKDCNAISEITFGEDLETIGEYAFYSTAVTSIKIPSSVTSIGYDAFGNCEKVESITVPFVGDGAEKKYIGYIFGAESYEENASTIPEVLTSVTVLGGEISDYAFYGCGGITSVTLSGNITAIGENAFKDCTAISEITVPFVGGGAENKYFGYIFGAASYEENASAVPVGLTSVTVLGGEIADNAFYGCDGITSVTLSGDITAIGENAFKDCTAISEITLNDGLETIGTSAFENCSALNTINVPATVTSIGDNAFKGCTAISETTFGEGLETIGEYAFYSTAVTSIKIPSNVTSIGYNAFGNCEAVENITVPFVGGGAENKYFGYIFGAASYEENASAVPAGLTSVTVLGGEIADNAFYGCDGITSVTLSENITAIGTSAFENCSALNTINVPATVTSIGDNAFSGCLLITEITIPESVNQIGNNAFSGCTALTEIHYAGTEANWANVTKGENWIDESCTVVFDKTEEEPAPEEPGTGEGSGESGNDENQSPDVPENGENDNPVTDGSSEEENGNEGTL